MLRIAASSQRLWLLESRKHFLAEGTFQGDKLICVNHTHSSAETAVHHSKLPAPSFSAQKCTFLPIIKIFYNSNKTTPVCVVIMR